MSWYISPVKSLTKLRFKSENQERRLIRIAKNGRRSISSIRIIQKALKLHKDKVVVLWSGGRCSTVVLHQVLRLNPNVKVLFVNTGVEYPETITYVRRLSERWKVNLTILRPQRTFWELVIKYGFPTMRKPYNQRSNGEPDTPPCCYWLKKKPVEDFVKENDIEALITGLRACESTVRTIVFNQKGSQFYYVKSEGVWKYHPIAFWTTEMVCKYLVKNNIPLNPLYVKHDRVGCWPCSSFKGWKEQLSIHPKFYHFLERTFEAYASPCWEGKAMNHLSFEDPKIGRKIAKLFAENGIKVEVHKNGKVICIPSNIPEELVNRVIRTGVVQA